MLSIVNPILYFLNLVTKAESYFKQKYGNIDKLFPEFGKERPVHRNKTVCSNHKDDKQYNIGIKRKPYKNGY